MKLFHHPVSSSSQKVLLAFYERGVEFEPVIVDMFNAAENTAYQTNINPIGKIPCLQTDDGGFLPESSIIIEYADRLAPGGPRLIPDDPQLALQTRLQDRFIDLYVMYAMQAIHHDRLRPEGAHDAFGVEQTRKRLVNAYRILDDRLATRTWLTGEHFSMADCGAAPALNSGQRAEPFTPFKHLVAYYERLMNRPQWQRVWAYAQKFIPQAQSSVEAQRTALGFRK